MPFMTKSHKRLTVTSTVFCSLETSHSVRPTLKGKGMRFHLPEERRHHKGGASAILPFWAQRSTKIINVGPLVKR